LIPIAPPTVTLSPSQSQKKNRLKIISKEYKKSDQPLKTMLDPDNITIIIPEGDSKEMQNIPRSKSQEIFRLSQISPKINDSSEGETTSSRAEYRKTKGRIDDPSFSSSEDKSGKKMVISNSSEEKGQKKKKEGSPDHKAKVPVEKNGFEEMFRKNPGTEEKIRKYNTEDRSKRKNLHNSEHGKYSIRPKQLDIRFSAPSQPTLHKINEDEKKPKIQSPKNKDKRNDDL